MRVLMVGILGGVFSAGCSLILNWGDDLENSGAFDASSPGNDADRNDASPAAICGNGVLEGGEDCDDENDQALDGCLECSVEAGYQCTGEPSQCSLVPICPVQTIVGSDAPLTSCKAYFDAGYRASGTYFIDVDGAGAGVPYQVLCDMKTGGGGWTVVTNNAADAVEPDGCMPRIGTVDAFVCGAIECDTDFVVLAHGLSFTELAWVVHDGDFVAGPHNLFRWSATQTFPNTQTWSLSAEEYNQLLDDLAGEEIIQCQNQGGTAVQRVANEHPNQNAGGFVTGDVITIFDRDTDPANSGKMSLTDVMSIGLDDFQDGQGCADLWAPQASRGAPTLIMVR